MLPNIDRVFYINMDQSVERRRNMEELLARIGAEGIAERVPGVDWRGVIPPWFRPRGRRNLRGHFGCALSHLECYRRMAAGGYGRVLIVEDDITVEHPEMLREYLAELPAFDIAYLAWGKTAWTRRMNQHWDRFGGQIGAWSYIIERRCLDWLLQMGDPTIRRVRKPKAFGGVIDRFLSAETNGLTLVRSRKNLIPHRGKFPSEIRRR